jgi:hypothetical protein
MKKILLILTITLASCTQHTEKYCISVPDRSQQFSYYYYTNDYTVIDDERGCITFDQDTLTYTLCGNYTIERINK